ncbi:MAG: rhodanese-like domain-containing protein [Cocleimonas sp.]|nr:rhodanese-like domain-containing protein [Cocleimonas sp.]
MQHILKKGIFIKCDLKISENYIIHLLLSLVFFILLFSTTEAAPIPKKSPEINITTDFRHLDVIHKGRMVRIEREQNPQHRLTNNFAKTSRICPPSCVQPFQIKPMVGVVGELELLNFISDKAIRGKGILLDGRLPPWHAQSTIPSAINLPYPLFDNKIESTIIKRLFVLLGAEQLSKNKWDFSHAKELLIFGNGVWGNQASNTIKNLLILGYPANKLHWYRGGLQDWLQVGFTTISKNR